MVEYNFSLNAKAGACFRTKIAAVTLCLAAVATAGEAPNRGQPYVS